MAQTSQKVRRSPRLLNRYFQRKEWSFKTFLTYCEEGQVNDPSQVKHIWIQHLEGILQDQNSKRDYRRRAKFLIVSSISLSFLLLELFQSRCIYWPIFSLCPILLCSYLSGLPGMDMHFEDVVTSRWYNLLSF